MLPGLDRLWLPVVSLGSCLALAFFGAQMLLELPSSVDEAEAHQLSLKAIENLRTISAAQARFAADGTIDEDHDGLGEYGFLRELGGNLTRGAAGRPRPSLIGTALTSAVVNTRGHRAALDGHYVFQVWLPGRGGAPLSDAVSIEFAGPGAIQTDQAEQRWCAYAWPASEVTGQQPAYYVGVEGTIWATDWNHGPHYQGLDSGPDTGAASSAGGSVWSGPAGDGRPSRDGRIWYPLLR
ncbi:hypothetical protein [Engelhardtia mirabilis]|uniref:Uncharacterized protein n=1 Tax=Engelhardtia mirabilis TaxID=2528011 RepID=A0A518BGF9_9BACT|nr:hypothetical protein Pla133_11170 [Planctomycetes bacterium Pla133]QDV00378.1 hypothetical protein Pla86_11170 [Planctomycetes bacterium Pla86]